MDEIFPYLMRTINLQSQESQQTTSKINIKNYIRDHPNQINGKKQNGK